MTGWRAVALGDLAREAGGFIKTGPFGSQLHAHEYVDDSEGVPVVMPKDMLNGRINRNSVSRISETTAQRLGHHRLTPGDIVLARRGDIGRFAFVEDDEAGWICGTGCLRIHAPASGVVESRFLRHLLASSSSIDWLAGQAVGATMPNLNATIVEKLPLHVPSPVTQRRIAAVLSAFDDLIEINERRIELLESVARSLYQEWFVRFRFPGHEALADDGESVPDGWTVRRFEDFAEVVSDGVAPDEVPLDSPYVGLEHLPRRQTTLRDWAHPESVTSRKLRFMAGDTLFGKIRPYFHKVVWAPFDGIASSDAIVLHPRDEGSHAAFVNTVAASDQLVAISVATSNGTKMPRADSRALLNYELAVPDDTLLGRFEGIARPLLGRGADLVAHNRALAATRDLLLPRLVTGRLDIDDINLGDLLSEPAPAT